MNKARRKDIDDMHSAITLAHQVAETLRDEEQESFDNLPEGLQQSEQGQRSEFSAEALDRAQQALSEALDALDEARNGE
jgi:uncharacterized membrane protein YccC